MRTENLTALRGDTYRHTFTFPDEGEPLDLGGHTFEAQVRRTPNAEESFDFTIDDTFAGTGQITVTLSASDASQMNGTYFYDVQSTHDGEVKTWVGGKFIVEADVTR